MEPWVYVVLLGAVLAVYSWVGARNEHPSSSKLLQQFQEGLTSFSAEMEQENRDLAEMIAQSKEAQEQKLQQMTAKVDQLETRQRTLELQLQQAEAHIEKLRQQQLQTKAEPMPMSVPVSAQPAAISESGSGKSQQPTIAERYNELFALYRQGKSTEQIARKLGMNKGEVLLILQLAKQEDQLRA